MNENDLILSLPRGCLGKIQFQCEQVSLLGNKDIDVIDVEKKLACFRFIFEHGTMTLENHKHYPPLRSRVSQVLESFSKHNLSRTQYEVISLAASRIVIPHTPR